MKKHKRPLTREERTLLKLRVLCLLWALFLVLVLLLVDMDAEVHEEEPAQVTQFETGLQPIPVVQAAYKAPIVIEAEAAPQATEQIDVDPTRDDIPLDKDAQVLLYEACGETGVPFELALAVIWKETRFQNISGDGGNSVGYMQVQERFHWDRMERLGVTDLADPYGNFLVGCDYLAEMLDKERGVEWALMAYNGGPSYANNMAKAGKVSQYATDVLNYMKNLGGY
jgi:soluble lytic murein transglycosylase-like protein